MKDNSSITAVVPVKKNSSRLPGKNFLPFRGFDTLLESKIDYLKKTKNIDRILVSSDSEEAMAIAKKMNVDFELRPIEFANESRPLSDFFEYIGGLITTDHMLWACVTSPLIDNVDFDKIINKYKNNCIDGNYDSIITVSDFQHYLMDQDGPLNYELGAKHLNSDSLPKLSLFTNGCLICSVKNLIKWKYNYGNKAYRYKVPQNKSIDIDTKWDYITAIAWEKEMTK